LWGLGHEHDYQGIGGSVPRRSGYISFFTVSVQAVGETQCGIFALPGGKRARSECDS